MRHDGEEQLRMDSFSRHDGELRERDVDEALSYSMHSSRYTWPKT